MFEALDVVVQHRFRDDSIVFGAWPIRVGLACLIRLLVDPFGTTAIRDSGASIHTNQACHHCHHCHLYHEIESLVLSRAFPLHVHGASEGLWASVLYISSSCRFTSSSCRLYIDNHKANIESAIKFKR